MRKVVLAMFVTLDGLIEGPDGEMDWNTDVFDSDMEKLADQQLAECDTLLLGRTTYEIFAGAWPSMTGDYADKMNRMDKVVFSRTLTTAEWNNSRVAEDPAGEIARLKALPGENMLIFGSAELSRSLMRQGLIDEYRLWVHPVILGSGKPLFEADYGRAGLQLANTQTCGSGVIVLTYHPA